MDARIGNRRLSGTRSACLARQWVLIALGGVCRTVTCMASSSDPIRVDIHRGESVESRHHVHGVVASVEGLVSVWGDADRLTMPRSSIKSIQVLPMLMSGAAEAFDVSDDEVALSSASHSAEPTHITAVQSWLHRLGLDTDALECGPTDPISSQATHELYRSGGAPTRLHNCCSGKHSGFLTLARHREADPAFALPGYLDPAHGVQQLVREAQAAYTGVDLASQTPVVDGCGIPVYQFPLSSLAQAMARLVTPNAVPEYEVAAARVRAALPSRSYLVSGTGRADDVITQAATEPLIIKGGAEGVSMGALPDRGIGFALKCEDGAHRGVEEAVAAVLHDLGALPERISMNSPITNAAADAVGHVTVSL